MKIITTIALSILSLNSYSDSIEDCYKKAVFEKETFEAALSGVKLADYLEGIEVSKRKDALSLYQLYNAYSGGRLNGHYQETTPEFWAHTMAEGNSIDCYQTALGFQ